MLVLVLLVLLAIIALTLTAVIIGILVLRNHQENRLKAYWTLLLQKSRIILGVFGAVIGLFVVYVVIGISNQPPAPCSAGLVPVSQKPSALFSAQDYFAQGDYDYERGDCDAAITDYTRGNRPRSQVR